MEGDTLRVGIGYDSHPLVSLRKLVLGGVEIPYDKGLSGWSDADVAVHAIIDALCGVTELGDIGALFPPQEPRYKDVSSLNLLQETGGLLKAKGFKVVNIDVIIMAQSPKLSSFIPEMRRRISRALGLDFTRVTVKATTTNSLGFIGREEGMAAQAVALIQRQEPGR
ncbi:MAG: 2-C-methyl-D-erythritol 2,4-cyclodiphosphate synthase [Dehalococcoidia bacterium]